MAVYAIVRSNAVIRGWTTDAELPVAPTERKELYTGPHPGAGYFVWLSALQTRPATLQEIRDARVDAAMEAERRSELRRQLLDRVAETAQDPLMPPRLRALCLAWQALLDDT